MPPPRVVVYQDAADAAFFASLQESASRKSSYGRQSRAVFDLSRKSRDVGAGMEKRRMGSILPPSENRPKERLRNPHSNRGVQQRGVARNMQGQHAAAGLLERQQVHAHRLETPLAPTGLEANRSYWVRPDPILGRPGYFESPGVSRVPNKPKCYADRHAVHGQIPKGPAEMADECQSLVSNTSQYHTGLMSYPTTGAAGGCTQMLQDLMQRQPQGFTFTHPTAKHHESGVVPLGPATMSPHSATQYAPLNLNKAASGISHANWSLGQLPSLQHNVPDHTAYAPSGPLRHLSS